MPTLERAGAVISYELSGQGPAVLLGHSLLCDHRMWDGVVPALAERYRVINIDFRGHGGSTAPAPFTFADLVGDWLAVMDAEKVGRAALCGLSMGGMTAMRLALRAPERVGPMILVDSNADPEGWWRRVRYGILARLYRKRGLTDALAARVAPIMLAETTMLERPEIAERFVERMRGQEREPLIRAIRAVNGRGPTGDLGAIRAPTLILVGEEDAATPPPRSEAIHRGIAGSQLVRIPGAGHLSAMEQPEAVARHVLGFLDAHPW